MSPRLTFFYARQKPRQLDKPLGHSIVPSARDLLVLTASARLDKPIHTDKSEGYAVDGSVDGFPTDSGGSPANLGDPGSPAGPHDEWSLPAYWNQLPY